MQLLKIITTIVIFLLTCCGVRVRGQNKGTVTGVVKDAITHTPIAYVSVSLIDKNTNLSIHETQTDASGFFVVSNLHTGVFKIQLSFVGYETLVTDSINITLTNNTIDVGVINLYAAKNALLSAVTVTAKKGTLQNIAGKKVFQVNQSLVSNGGTAADILQNVPTLQIDADGNVNLRGSAGVQVFVDGKPSLIAGGNITQVLQSIPASSIERVEIINNPTAKYDAGGQSIINIVLKANTKRGFNGNVAATGGTRSNFNAAAGLSYLTNKVNVYGNYSYSHVNTYSTGVQYINYLNSTGPAYFSDEWFPSLTLNLLHNAKAGIDYYISPKSTLSFSGSFNARNRRRHEFLTINQLDESKAPVQTCNCNNDINGTSTSYNLNLDYSQKFNKPGEELSFNLGYAYGSNSSNQVYNQNMLNISGNIVDTALLALQSISSGNNTNYNIQADYNLPIGKSGVFEAGYRTQLALGNSNQHGYSLDDAGGDFKADYGLYNVFTSNNQVHALYASYQGHTGDFSYQFGLRAEDALLSATLVSYDTSNVLHNTPIKITNTGLYPSVFLTQKLQHNQQVQLSYTRRVTRPTSDEINPFKDESDPVNYDTGNPYLLPESIHSVEASYGKNWQKVSFTAALYFILRNNVIKHVQTTPVNDVTFTIPENLPSAINSGIELIGHFTVVKAWDFTANLNVYDRQNAAAPQFGIAQTSGLSFNTNITNNITVVKNLVLQIRADYRSGDVVIQDRNRAAFGLDAGARYDFPNKKASLTFSSRDIFNSRKWAFLRESDTILLDFWRRTQSSRASLTFAYSFGKPATAAKKVKKAEEQQEKRIDAAS